VKRSFPPDPFQEKRIGAIKKTKSTANAYRNIIALAVKLLLTPHKALKMLYTKVF